ncbi:MAG: class I SAM-dependent methyltransferase, partial [Patescibacteria group bacterium]
DPVGKKTLDVMSHATYYNRWLFSQIVPYLKSPVVEVGAGTGNFLSFLVGHGFKTTAIDQHLEYLKSIQKTHSVEVYEFDLQKSILPSGLYKKFNSAISLNVLEHIPNISQAMKNIFDMLAPSGTAFILVPSTPWAYNRLDKNLGHVKRYTIPQINSIAKRAGFQVIKSYYINPLGLIGWIVSGLIMRNNNLTSGSVKLFDIISRPFLFIEKFVHPPLGLSLITILKKS